MKNYQSIVILTGSGISAESGIKTFRASDGLWENHRVEDVATPEAYFRDPETVQRFYNERRHQLLNQGIQPNAAHKALADLEKNFKGEFLLVTQNIDNLHEQAGNQNIIHIHGELLKMRCVNTDKIYPINNNITQELECACCQQQNTLRPHVVWFGEMPLELDSIYSALEQCDCFIAIGTSGSVYPAAGFVQIANQVNAHTVELNLEPSAVESNFIETKYGPATQVVTQYVNDLLN